jgi:hypothetical protein
MGFNGPQVLEDAERLIAAWNERQAKRMPMLFSPTIGAGQASPTRQRIQFACFINDVSGLITRRFMQNSARI